jgi:hypothetical protein
MCRDTQDIHISAIFNFTFHLVKEHSGVKTSQLISAALLVSFTNKTRHQVTDFFVTTVLQTSTLKVVELNGIEPLTFCVQGRRSPS